MSRALLVVVAVVSVVALAADPALACAVCGTQKTQNDWAFGATTVLLSILPPAMFAGLVVFIVRAAKKHAAQPDDTHNVSTPD